MREPRSASLPTSNEPPGKGEEHVGAHQEGVHA
jgi:hypothetical protein